MTQVLTVAEVNELDRDAFTQRFARVYESTPVLAATAWADRPFANVTALVDAFRAAVARFDDAEVLELLRAHPQLAAATPMTLESRSEQRSAGLTDLDDATRTRIVAGNERYRERFGFPFIIAVRGRRPREVLGALEDRLENSRPTELATAVVEVQRIAEMRITQLVTQ